jgi:pimeloyl-ACP methyl ester carboxylesterase
MTLPYNMQHEIELPYSGGALGGVLLTPPFSGQHPAVVLLPGLWDYFRRNAQLHDNPLEWLRQVRCPVLAIFGASDLLLPVDSSVERFRQSLAQAGNKDVTIKVFSNSGHLITNPGDGELARGFLELITNWLKQRVQISKTR